MAMKALIVSRIDRDDALAFSKELKKVLEEEDCEVVFDPDTARALKIPGIAYADASVDVVVIIGGDGTILRAVQQMDRQVPLIGINWGEVGFLADLEPAGAVEFLRTICRGFSVEERMRITLLRDGIPLGNALNEALIVTTRPAKMLRFSVIVDGIVAEEFRSDGLLISTPTGSTAYAMSAGGPIVDPRIQGFLLVPLAPYMLSSRPHLISSNRRVKIRLESSKPANLVIDGQQTINLGSAVELEVKMAKKPALFVDAHRNFFEKVENKLRKL